MIEIITKEVLMPDLDNRKFQKQHINNKWSVIDTMSSDIVYKGKFEDVCLACLNLNKKHYLLKGK